ncbi:LysR substrate-binding domain-containing protein [Vibrio sp. SS-MA-C1-2]|uniref:LysR substrate-binding domain-containing protein n=1 Tax=Vibrio sp. SS-MA-C1-2 TaxID=2908646 RepID=UPI001F48B60B|nr:LysR substrate-binding domain-containing protein [Vibrio sp. SS-MA-C1-2]UJF17076.1 LysR substrate-binding domain-containing protein [Vibrio sp. SS-MA-C1-2]
MNLNLLKTFDIIMKTKSISKTSSLLGVSTPAVSYTLAKLREEYDDPLFIRTADGVEPTMFAISLHNHIHNSLMEILSFNKEELKFDASLSTRIFKIASHPDIDIHYHSDFIKKIKILAPHAQVVFVPTISNTEDRLESLRVRSVDIILSVNNYNRAGFKSVKVIDANFCVCAAKNHPRIQNDLSIEQLFEEDHIQWVSGKFQDVIFNQIGRRPNYTYHAQSSMLGLYMASKSELLALSNTSIANRLTDKFEIQILPLPFYTIKTSAYVSWHKSRDTDIGHKWFREVLLETIKNSLNQSMD